VSREDPRAKIRFSVDSKRADARIVQAVVAAVRDRLSTKPPPPEEEESDEKPS